ncbi:uncharacterized protein EDB91DRAFT_1247355 [Suillus paluster]|uniref:uncharacterized protein n=1 Tax=Suillus paluster TaxID=48578 RepID=UPI001B8843B9|nr:uncharacterized protein EDB91DRAFT_1247355 [Suillus paluster]KAG1743274.1 hypothetical protein EDB91DRAFT_1247355 [Suillus paluster]
MSPGPSSIPIASLDISATLVHPSSLTTAQITITNTQQKDTPMDDTPINNEPPSHANCEIPMDQDVPAATPLPLISPITHSEPASSIPTSSGRHRALSLPLITENYLGQLVNQQFAQLSNKVVVPALRSAVDTMIPTIIEWITGETMSIHSTCSHTTPPALTHTWKHCGSSEDDDASEPDCDDNLTPSPCRKHLGKWGIKNKLHRSFRIYLWEKCLLQSPPSQTVHTFTHYNESPPSLGNITINWQDSLRSSLWNTEAINLMVVDFQEKIQTGSHPLVIFNEDTMNLSNLHLLCIDKLHQTQQAYRQCSKIEEFRDVQEREEATHELSSCSTWRQHLDRLNNHKHRTLKRCQKIAEQNCHHNPQTWDTIKRIIDRLDVDGMSEDETDTAIGAKLKIVRHVALPWISPAITDLLHTVESYVSATYKENMSVPNVLLATQSLAMSPMTIAQLSSSNYLIWRSEMESYLRSKGLWLLVSGSEKRPADSQPEAQALWDLKADQAAGELYLACPLEMRSQIDAIEDHPVLIWSTLASLYSRQRCSRRNKTKKLSRKTQSLTGPTVSPSPTSFPIPINSTIIEFAGTACLRSFDPSSTYLSPST